MKFMVKIIRQTFKVLSLKSTLDGSITDLKVDGVFIAIGHDPATQIFKGKVEMDDEGYIITKPDSTVTSVEGVYAAGDVKDKKHLGKLLLLQEWDVWLLLRLKKFISGLE